MVITKRRDDCCTSLLSISSSTLPGIEHPTSAQWVDRLVDAPGDCATPAMLRGETWTSDERADYETQRSIQTLSGRAAFRHVTTRSLAFFVPSHAPTGHDFDITMPLYLSSSIRGW